MSELPVGWIRTNLGSIADIEMGQSPKGEFTNTESIGLPLVGGAADYDGGELSVSRFTSAPTKVCSEGDIILCIRATIGKVAFACRECCLGRGVAGICSHVEPMWLRYKLIESADALDEAGVGTTFRQVDKKTLQTWPVHVPPLPEQRRIVAKIDSLSAKSKRARDNLDHIPRLVEKYKQSILEAAFEGKLTRLAPSSFVDTRLGDILLDGPQNGLYLPQNKYGHGTPILRIQNYGLFDADDVSLWRRVQISPAVSSQYAMVVNDLIINRVNSPSHLGKSIVVTKNMAGAVFESNMMRMHFRPSVAPRYVQLYLSSELGRRRLTEKAKWAVNQASINQTDVANTIIPIVSFDEQERILNQIRVALGRIDRLVVEATSARKLIDHLDQAVLTKAFRGELVSQDPNDEPARVLLERIRAERQVAAASSSLKKRRVDARG